jgi:hypothetical protein
MAQENNGYIGMFRVPEAGAIIPVTNDASNMTMQILEDAVDSATGTTSSAIINFSNVDILTSGASITEVIIQHRFAGIGNYDNVGTYNVNWTGEENVDVFVYGPVAWNLSGIEHDFRAYFQNSDGQLAVQTNGDVIGIDVFVEDINVEFNGFPDLSEYPEVLDLVADNASDVEGGTFAEPAIIPANGIIRLAWKDMRTQDVDLGPHPMADGDTDTVTVIQWRNTIGYKIFMYIAVPVTGNKPTDEWPNPDEPAANGTWYLVGETVDHFTDIDCPKADKICFWVGAVLGRLDGDSKTIDIPKAKYKEYIYK